MLMSRLTLLVLVSLILLHTSYGQESCSSENSLRLNPLLVNTSWSESGRLEICYCDSNDCTWNTISTGNSNTDNGWSWNNVQVACRQLRNDTGIGYTGLGNPIFWSSTANDSDIYTSVFTCDGTETNLTDCTQSPLTSNDVTEVYITCSKTVTTGHVKLSGSTTAHQGAVEVYVRSTGQWETVCVDNFHDAEADVTCRTLGYASGVLAVLATTSFRGNQINKTTGISGIVCTGSERDIDSCFFTRSTSCSRTNVLAGVTCTPSTSGTGSARLFTLSTFNNFQRVEVLFGGRWGSVCETSWDHTDGQVTCQSLNRPVEDTEVPTNFIPIIASQRPIWVYGYHCNGTETNLTLCSLVNDYPIGYAPGCNHTHDAGLYCGNFPSSGGGLSGGAIAGIVIGTLVGVVCLVLLGVGLACFIYKCCCDGDCECREYHYEYHYHREYDCSDCDCDCGCLNCFKSSRRNRRVDNRIPINLSHFTTTTERRESLTEEERVVQEYEKEQEEKKKKEKDLEDAELSKPAPPSYNDALTLEGMTTLPEYMQDEEKKDGDSKPSDPLPYPIIDSDPAYPPPTSTSSEV